jgi:hypothetical protein
MSKRENRTSPELRQVRTHPAVRNYMLICLAALFMVVLCLAERDLEWWSLIPAFIGCLTLLTYWNHGPPLVLLSLAGLLGMARPGHLRFAASWMRLQSPSPMDCILCLAVLAYVMTHYRLLALVRRIFPDEGLARGLKNETEPMPRRSADLVSSHEMVLLATAFPLWSGVAVLVWIGLMESSPPLRMPWAFWRALQIVWMLLALLAASGVVVHYRRRSTATPEESLLYLQDELWRHTRREQSLFHRWLMWTRLRTRRKE